MNADEFVRTARGYLGVPYRHQGRDRSGLDCGGLWICACRDMGLNIDNDLINYPTFPNFVDIASVIEAYADRIQFQQIQPGDVVLLRIAGRPQHFAIVTDMGLLHVNQIDGRVVEHAFDKKWQRRYKQGYRFR